MRDSEIYKLINTGMENVQKALGVRMMMYERLIKEITEQLGGYILLINSIPVYGILLRKLVEKYIRRYQKILKVESIKLYQKQKKEKEKENELDKHIK